MLDISKRALANALVNIEDFKFKLKEKYNYDSVTYIDGDHLDVQICDSTESLLFQVVDGKIIAWGYETQIIPSQAIIVMITESFRCPIIFPYVDNTDDIRVLKSLGYRVTKFEDDIIDEECKIHDSFIMWR